MTVADNISIQDGIEHVRATLPRMWFDEKKCKRSIKDIKEKYRQEYDHNKRVYKMSPRHDWASHPSDAMRYLCVSLSKLADGMTPKELEERYQRVSPRTGPDLFLQAFFDPNENVRKIMKILLALLLSSSCLFACKKGEVRIA